MTGLAWPDRSAVALFAGGRGSASIARHLLRTPGVTLSLLINGYDNGQSTGALRRYLPGMLGPSDFRKNLLIHLDRADPEHAALQSVLRYRLPAGATTMVFHQLIDALTFPELAHELDGVEAFSALPTRARHSIVDDLSTFACQLERRSCERELELGDCALGNLILAGAYLRLGRDFNAAVQWCSQTFMSPARLLNITNGENAFLAAVKQDGRLLPDEADIVAPQDGVAISDLYLLNEPLSSHRLADLRARPAEPMKLALARRSATVSLSNEARGAIESADLLVYGPGTPHSSLLPSYLTPGVAEAIRANRSAAKVFVVNLRADNDVRGLNASDLARLSLSYLGDPLNEGPTITHILVHSGLSKSTSSAGGHCPARARWVAADVEDPHFPGVHSGPQTVAALAAIVRGATLVRS